MATVMNNDTNDTFLTAQNVRNSGIEAYREGEYYLAINRFLETILINQDDWLAHLYLAMAYMRSGQVSLSQQVFMTMVEGCPDKELRSKAENALLAIYRDKHKIRYVPPSL